jgi:hypothetical protein
MSQQSSNKPILLLVFIIPFLLAASVYAQENQPATQDSDAATAGQSAAIGTASSVSKREQNKKKHLTSTENKVIAEEDKLSARELKPLPATDANEEGQGQAPAPSAAAEAQELAKKLSNPVASLISVPFQSNFDYRMGSGSGWRYTLNVQPVIPIKLSPNWNLISRTIIPFIHQSKVVGTTSQTGLGDITQSLFFSPNKTEPLIWAVGPVFLLPTATNANLGTQKFGIGPTALALKQAHGWTYGILMNHIWSVAGKSSRADVNSTFIQPFLSYTTKDAWTYSLNTESTYDWNGHAWSVPINPFLSKLVRFGKQPVSFGVGVKCWATAPSGGPEACSLRIVVTALFPKR